MRIVRRILAAGTGRVLDLAAAAVFLAAVYLLAEAYFAGKAPVLKASLDWLLSR